MEHLVDAEMDAVDAEIKAPEESVTRFEESYVQQLYKKKYPPRGHMYLQGITNSFIFRQQINHN